MQENYFEILEIKEYDSLLKIRESYRRLVKKYHPDYNSSFEARERFALIYKAYQVLSDPLQRETYKKGVSNSVVNDPRKYLKDFWQNNIIKL